MEILFRYLGVFVLHVYCFRFSSYSWLVIYKNYKNVLIVISELRHRVGMWVITSVLEKPADSGRFSVEAAVSSTFTTNGAAVQITTWTPITVKKAASNLEYWSGSFWKYGLDVVVSVQGPMDHFGLSYLRWNVRTLFTLYYQKPS
jgi:hypothetical protein